jgi:hypothetical protein
MTLIWTESALPAKLADGGLKVAVTVWLPLAAHEFRQHNRSDRSRRRPQEREPRDVRPLRRLTRKHDPRARERALPRRLDDGARRPHADDDQRERVTEPSRIERKRCADADEQRYPRTAAVREVEREQQRDERYDRERTEASAICVDDAPCDPRSRPGNDRNDLPRRR